MYGFRAENISMVVPAAIALASMLAGLAIAIIAAALADRRR